MVKPATRLTPVGHQSLKKEVSNHVGWRMLLSQISSKNDSPSCLSNGQHRETLCLCYVRCCPLLSPATASRGHGGPRRRQRQGQGASQPGQGFRKHTGAAAGFGGEPLTVPTVGKMRQRGDFDYIDYRGWCEAERRAVVRPGGAEGHRRVRAGPRAGGGGNPGGHRYFDRFHRAGDVFLPCNCSSIMRFSGDLGSPIVEWLPFRASALRLSAVVSNGWFVPMFDARGLPPMSCSAHALW